MEARNGSMWRKKSKRGVSPIIATILLVAITVVLAAVLYVLISGLTKGPGNTPLGTAYAWGPASTITGSATSAGCPTGKVCYSLEIASATSGLTGAGLTFSGRTSGGSSAPLGTDVFTLVTASGLAGNATWTGSGACVNGAGTTATCNTPLASGMTIVLNSAATSGDPLSGDAIVAIGGGSFSGEVTSGSLT